MWRQFAKWVTANYVNGIVVLAIIQLCATFFSLLNIVSGAMVALLCFRHDMTYRVLIPVLAAILVAIGAAATTLADVPFSLVAWPLVYFWLPIFIIAWMWRETSMSLALQVLGALGAGTLVAFHILDYVPGLLVQMIDQSLARMEDAESMALAEELTHDMVAVINSAFIASFVIWWALCALFGRWMYLSPKENPEENLEEDLKGNGAFRSEMVAEMMEFHLGIILTALLVVATIVGTLGGHPVGMGAVVILSTLFLLQGVITVHQIVVILSDEPRFWLIGFYILFVASLWFSLSAAMHAGEAAEATLANPGPVAMLGIIVLGALENFINLKKRCLNLKEKSNS